MRKSPSSTPEIEWVCFEDDHCYAPDYDFWHHFAALPKTNCTYLVHELRITRSLMTNKDIANCVTALHRNAPVITCLRIQSPMLFDADLIRLTELLSLTAPRHLHAIKIIDARITHVSIPSLMRSIKACSSVQRTRFHRLELSDCTLGDTGIRALMQSMVHFQCQINELVLRNCGVASSVYEIFATVALVGHSTELLDISYNPLDDYALARAMPFMRTFPASLRVLNLRGCALHELTFGMVCMTSSLLCNTQLRVLDMRYVRLHRSHLYQLFSELRRNNTLTSLRLDDRFDDDINELIKKDRTISDRLILRVPCNASITRI